MRHIEYCEVTLMLTHKEDEIFVETYWPSPHGTGPLRMVFTAPHGQGLAYIQQHFKVKAPRVLNFRVLPDE